MVESRQGRRVSAFVLALGFALFTAFPAWAEESVTIYLWEAWLGEAHYATGLFFDAVKAVFEEENPGVKVHYQHVPFGPDTLILAVSAGIPPDASIVSVAYAVDLYELGVLAPLNEYWERSPIGSYTFLPSARTFNRAGEIIYGVPWSMEATTIIYNVDMFEELGFDPDPDAMATWDDFIAYGRSLHRVTGDGQVTVAGFDGGLSLPTFVAWLYSNNGAFYADDYKSVAFNTPQGRETLKFLAELYTIHQLGGLSGVGNFHAGRIGMQLSQIPATAAVTDAPFRAAQTDFPRGPSGRKRSTVGWSNMFALIQGAARPDLGWKWIETMIRIDLQKVRAQLRASFPNAPYLEVYQAHSEAEVQEMLRNAPYNVNTLRILQDAGVYPFYRYQALNPVLGPLLTQVRLGQQAPESALEEMVRLANVILQE